MYARRFVRAIRSGSSLPLLVEAEDGQHYVVKGHGSGDGPLASIVDWIALHFGARLGLPMAEPVIIEMDAEFAKQAEDPEVRELIERSAGSNFATVYVEARPASEATLDTMSPLLRKHLLLYDVLLLNIDRTSANPNALQTERGVVCLDFAASMTLRAVLLGNPVNATPYLAQLRQNPLYAQHIDAETFVQSLMARRSELGGIVASIPDPWLHGVRGAHAVSQTLTTRIDEFIGNASSFLSTTLSALDAVVPESNDERLLRYAENKAAFEQRFGTL